MSWFSDIAGKAEDFLNKIDQNAAVALTTIEEKTHSRRNSKTFKNAPLTTEEVAEAQRRNSTGVPVQSASEGANGILPSASRIQSGTNHYGKDHQHNQSHQDQSIINGTSTTESKPKQQQNGSGRKSTKQQNQQASTPKKKSDEELMDFLNSKEQREIDEVTLLKNELATQSRELNMMLKQNKKLQMDCDKQKGEIHELKSSINQGSVDINAITEVIQKELDVTRATLKEKEDEIEALREKLDNSLMKLNDIENFHQLETKVQQLELENRQLKNRQSETELNLKSLEDAAAQAGSQIQCLKESLAKAEADHAVYKEKAKSILRSKDEVIASLKSGRLDVNGSDAKDVHHSESEVLAEIGSLRNERELLHGEISQSRVMYESCKEDNRKLEQELQKIRVVIADLHEKLARERTLKNRAEEENLQHSQKISVLSLELDRERSEKRKFEEQLQKLSVAEKSLRLNVSQLDDSTAASPLRYSPSYDTTDKENLKTRVKALTQSLLDKQSLINSISADKQLLQIRVERLEQQLKDFSAADGGSGLTQTVISSQPLYLSESPWDSGVTQKVKRAYSKVDSLFCQLGLAMRHRPNLRLGFAAYVVCLHLWVFLILVYWSHSTPLPPSID